MAGPEGELLRDSNGRQWKPVRESRKHSTSNRALSLHTAGLQCLSLLLFSLSSLRAGEAEATFKLKRSRVTL